MENIDAQSFKIRDAASYDGITDQFDNYTEQLSNPLASHLVSLAGITANEHVLDVGTGTGVVALQTAKMLGPNGLVHGIDLSEGMLATANEKATRLGLGRKVKFSRMDAERLELEDRSFDAVLSLFALLHFPTPLTALKEMYRVMRPGGKLVLAVGSGPPLFSLSGLTHRVKRFPDLVRNAQGKLLVAPGFLNSMVEKYFPERDAPEESHLASHSHNRTQAVPVLIREAGFDLKVTSWKGHQALIDTPEDFWEIQRTFSSIARKRLSDASADKVEALRKEFFEKCRVVQSRGGRLVYPFAAFYVVANRPQ